MTVSVVNNWPTLGVTGRVDVEALNVAGQPVTGGGSGGGNNVTSGIVTFNGIDENSIFVPNTNASFSNPTFLSIVSFGTAGTDTTVFLSNFQPGVGFNITQSEGRIGNIIVCWAVLLPSA
jgi:hypothetical protein